MLHRDFEFALNRSNAIPVIRGRLPVRWLIVLIILGDWFARRNDDGVLWQLVFKNPFDLWNRLRFVLPLFRPNSSIAAVMPKLGYFRLKPFITFLSSRHADDVANRGML